ncbi:MAG: hypothetical protein LLG01_00680 [Planctomycetaceae bacterium]|nr:hypothetical protein [Planctomycetaceae bacterium]
MNRRDLFTAIPFVGALLAGKKVQAVAAKPPSHSKVVKIVDTFQTFGDPGPIRGMTRYYDHIFVATDNAVYRINEVDDLPVVELVSADRWAQDQAKRSA